MLAAFSTQPHQRHPRFNALRQLALGALLAGLTTFASAQSSPTNLPALGADMKQTSVSGLSSGAFMASQLQVAYSGSIVGAGVVAGGPYYCAANNMFYTGICMGQTFVAPNASLMVAAAKGFEQSKVIDPLSNLKKRRVYVFSGTDDSIVKQIAVDSTVDFFKQTKVPAAQLKYVNNMPAGHAVITPGYGNDCSANAAPYISHCSLDGKGYDQAGALLQHIYGTLNAQSSKSTGQMVAFDQTAFFSMPGALADVGYAYVPQSCKAGGCKVHVAIHGCGQSVQSVGNQFITDTGYNTWADTNQLIVLYPQVNKTIIPSNPAGCWDWWGYTGPSYAWKDSVQMKAIMGMVSKLGQKPQ